MLVVDAGVLAVAFTNDGEQGAAARERLRSQTLVAPELIMPETLSVLRRLTRGNEITVETATEAIAQLNVVPIQLAPHRPFIARCWQLRHNLTTYDATYVALAETLNAPLVTTDRRMANASGPRCPIEVLS